MGLMTALQSKTYSTRLSVGCVCGGAHTKTHTALQTTRGRIRNLMLNNELTVNTGQRAEETVKDQAVEA